MKGILDIEHISDTTTELVAVLASCKESLRRQLAALRDLQPGEDDADLAAVQDRLDSLLCQVLESLHQANLSVETFADTVPGTGTVGRLRDLPREISNLSTLLNEHRTELKDLARRTAYRLNALEKAFKDRMAAEIEAETETSEPTSQKAVDVCFECGEPAKRDPYGRKWLICENIACPEFGRYNDDLSRLRLDNRSANVLRNANIDSIEKVRQRLPYLRELKGVGRKINEAVKHALERYDATQNLAPPKPRRMSSDEEPR